MKNLFLIIFFSCFVIINYAQETPQVDESKLEFIKHKVKKRETLFSISQKYNIKVEDIKRFNKELYSRDLKKKEVIRIPIGLYALENAITTEKDASEIPIDSVTTKTHMVLPKETKYGIARKYGITLAELEAMNPEMGENLQIGAEIVVPTEVKIQDTAIEDDKFEYYEVLPKEGFYRLQVKLGLTQEEIIALNPYAKDGLKEGMIIKIPRNTPPSETKDFEAVDLENYIVNKKTKKLAVMLPFKLEGIIIDSVDVNKELLKTDATLRAALDFYSGVQMAADFAKDKGISTQIKVYDTEAKPVKVNEIIASNDFSEVDAVIGPLLSKNIEKASSMLKKDSVPVFSPLSKVKINQSYNLYQTQPSKEALQKAMLDYITKNVGDRNVVVISGNKWTKEKGEIIKALPQAKSISPKDGNFIKLEDITKQTDTVRENWMILVSDNPILVSNVVGLLNGLPEDILDEEFKKIGSYKIRLFAVDKNKAFDYDDVSNLHLAKLDFTFPSVSKHYVYDEIDPFLVSYKNRYGVYPNKYAIRGFDVTYDVLLRLASADSMLDASRSDIKTEYVESKFQYGPNEQDGFINNAFYIIKYNKELKLEVVK